ncbi:lysine-specific demethylase JMJ31 isoform X3 [Cucumis melo]|uniref:Lysine-specific demethylase JMJ31 isoform X3 n=1 Tax=Cucumis melo TaxID=3656 RepID=A0A1S3BR69_CUCME|nr:lysine-specific demethylase JMJ31 isoform X3 [Cucumis melo]XP_016901082.1 lysine-specific demethylase JMJ31 isoform X3 [Cucumis melo]XP_050936622.1 lysine-specific demethylase JMJ31 isoform X3 [Cucumis melo]
MDDNLHIQRFHLPPSPSHFESLIESRNVPAILVGCVKDWRALSEWNPYVGGLDNLQECAGSCIVEAMLTRTAPVFYGDLRSHDRVPIPFSTFIQICKQRLLEKSQGNVVSSELNSNRMTGPDLKKDCLPFEDDSKRLYLAQVPILDVINEERAQLEPLRKDIQTPAFLEKKKLASINLWMNSALSRSSTHYDPHHNVLCIVSGRKQVILWPPSATPSLYPMHIYGEASNHSSVSLEKPDYSLYPRAKYSRKSSQTVVLRAGDALFIPEGWFHQVDSDELTIAVNFWWQSHMMSSVSDHMDAYYLRRILRRLMDREMNEVLRVPCSLAEMDETKSHEPDVLGIKGMDQGVQCLSQAFEGGDLKEKELREETFSHELELCSARALHGLMTLVHDHVSVSDQTGALQSSSTNGSADGEESMNFTSLNSLENDQVAISIWNLEPCVLQKVLLTMANNFPRTLEALILHLLSPIGAEVLTRKFDQMDQRNTAEDQKRFYEVFYSSFDDQFAVMDAILNRKESFARQNIVLSTQVAGNSNRSRSNLCGITTKALLTWCSRVCWINMWE